MNGVSSKKRQVAGVQDGDEVEEAEAQETRERRISKIIEKLQSD